MVLLLTSIFRVLHYLLLFLYSHVYLSLYAFIYRNAPTQQSSLRYNFAKIPRHLGFVFDLLPAGSDATAVNTKSQNRVCIAQVINEIITFVNDLNNNNGSSDNTSSDTKAKQHQHNSSSSNIQQLTFYDTEGIIMLDNKHLMQASNEHSSSSVKITLESFATCGKLKFSNELLQLQLQQAEKHSSSNNVSEKQEEQEQEDEPDLLIIVSELFTLYGYGPMKLRFTELL